MQDAPLPASLVTAMGYVLVAEKRELREARKTAHTSRALLPWRRSPRCTAADLEYSFDLESRVIADSEAHAARKKEKKRDGEAHTAHREATSKKKPPASASASSPVAPRGASPLGDDRAGRHRRRQTPAGDATGAGASVDAAKAVLGAALSTSPTNSLSSPVPVTKNSPHNSSSPPSAPNAGHGEWGWHPSRDTAGSDARPAGLSGTGPSATGHPGSNPGGAWTQVWC